MRESTEKAIDFVESLMTLTADNTLVWRRAESGFLTQHSRSAYEADMGEYRLHLSLQTIVNVGIPRIGAPLEGMHTALSVLDSSGEWLLSVPSVGNLVNLYSLVVSKLASRQPKDSSIGLLNSLVAKAHQLMENSGSVQSSRP